MKPRITIKTSVQGVTDFLSKIYKFPPPDGPRCFRGEANSKWKLKPSVMRDLRPNAEGKIIDELMAEAPDEFSADKSMFGKLVRAQHYGLPTRLLDVSLNPLVALYFACADEPQKDEEARVRILDFRPGNVKFPESDTISIICNLARLEDKERDELKSEVFKKTVTLESIHELASAQRLLQFVRMEKSYFLPQMKPTDFKKYFFVYPSKSNRRVIAQSGAFVATGLLSYGTTRNIVSFSSRDLYISAGRKNDILKELDSLNIKSSTMFPEIEFTSRYIKRKWETQRTSDLEDLQGRLKK
jgi:hypothetical protein